MRVFAMGDLHLSFTEMVNPDQWEVVNEHKPMGCFGNGWEKHYKKIYANWRRLVAEDDLVLVPGDISWAMKLDDIDCDFDFISMLSGNKVFVQGNHDYWWQSVSKVRERLPKDCFAIQNDSLNVGQVTLAGTRGWLCPNDRQFTSHDKKIYNREILRLEMSLSSIKDRKETLISMMHYMPTNDKYEMNEFIELMQQYSVDICVYGHLHGPAHNMRLPKEKWGIQFQLVSADYLRFEPKEIQIGKA